MRFLLGDMTISEAAVQETLGRAGMVPTVGRDWPADASIPRFNAFVDPAGTERLGKWIAERSNPMRPNVVLVWNDPDTSVLAHIVCRELGIRWVCAYDEGGLIESRGRIEPGERVLLLADAFRNDEDIKALVALSSMQGGTIVGAASLVSTEPLETRRQEIGTVVSCFTRRSVGGPGA
jgi:hypothetical protein